MAAAATIDFVIEAKRKIVSRAIGIPASRSAEPTASTSTRSPRATSATAPATVPSSTYRPSRSRRPAMAVV